MEDKTIICADCSQPFVFTAGEQQFYAERGLTELPKRCKPCRNARRRRMGRRRRGMPPVEPAIASGEAPPLEAQVEEGSGSLDTALGEQAPAAPLEAREGADATTAAADDRSPGAVPGNGQGRSSAVRGFWDDRPQWVRDAIKKLSGEGEAIPVAVASEGDGGNGRVNEGRRRRRRSRRRGRRRPPDHVPQGTMSESPRDASSASGDPKLS